MFCPCQPTSHMCFLSPQNINHVDIPAAIVKKTQLYVELARETRVIEAVMDVARAAKARGLPCAIATGSNRVQAIKSLTNAGLMGEVAFFDAVVTCEVRAGGSA